VPYTNYILLDLRNGIECQDNGKGRVISMPRNRDRNDRIRQDVTDISSPDELLRFALAGQLEPLLRRGLTQGMIALGAGFGASSRNAGPALSRALANGPTAEQLHGLDEIIGTLNPDLDGVGSLSSLSLRLSAERRDTIRGSSLAARVPPSWTRKILADSPADEIGVLMQASALLSQFMAAGKMEMRDITASVRDRHRTEMDLLVRRLILVSVAPPTSRNYDAQILLGMQLTDPSFVSRARMAAPLSAGAPGTAGIVRCRIHPMTLLFRRSVVSHRETSTARCGNQVVAGFNNSGSVFETPFFLTGTGGQAFSGLPVPPTEEPHSPILGR